MYLEKEPYGLIGKGGMRMISTPVKDVKSLMNFMGGKSFTKAGNAAQAGSFGDVMNMAGNNANQSLNKPVSASQATEKKPAEETLKVQGENRKDTAKPQETVSEATEGSGKEAEGQSQAVEEAGKDIVKGIAQELGVSEEEVVKAMEELGLTLFALFEPSNLTQLALTLSGEQDTAAILTDEGLFASLQNLMGMAQDVKASLMQEMDLSPEEFQALLENMQQEKESGMIDTAPALQEETVQEAPKITVEVKAQGETIKLATDEKGNAVKTVEVTPTDTKEEAPRENTGGQEAKSGEGKGQAENSFQAAGQLANTLNQDTAPQVSEVPFEQAASMAGEQTREIMDQIMNYMRIQLRPGMEQLEMQLHPESLGTVHVQLVSKGGEVTAQFHVQNEAVKAAIESQISTLQENLREQGVKVEAVQVTVESHGFESNLWQGQGREEEAASQNNKKAPRRINLNDLGGFAEEDATEEELLTAKVMEMNGTTVDFTA